MLNDSAPPPPPKPARLKPAHARPAPSELPLLPWEMPSKPPFAIEKVMGLDTPPPVPSAPAFSGIEDIALPPGISSEDPGSVLELWFRKEGVSEKDIKKLNQLPADQKALIRKIVQAYQIDMQRTVLEMRPNYQKIRNDLDMLKLDLSRLILISDTSKEQSEEVAAILEAIALKEAELASLQGVQDKLTGVFEKEMTDQITEVVNAWIAAQASKTKESLSGLFKDADNTYGLKWD